MWLLCVIYYFRNNTFYWKIQGMDIVSLTSDSFHSTYSLFRLTSLMHAKKFEFENPAIMEAKQCKQTERFSVMAKKSDYFLSLDDESKQKYNVKIDNIQGNDPYQIKKEELSGDFSKLPPVQ